MTFDRHSLSLDAERTADRLCDWIQLSVRDELHKSGAVVGISGGIDSAVVAALCVRALGPSRVLGVTLPEHESEGVSTSLAGELSAKFGFELISREISQALNGLGCYELRDAAIKSVFPDFDEGWTAKITNPGSILEKQTFNFFRLTVEDREGQQHTARLPVDAYLQIVAASNLKQRTRMAALYYAAESRNRAVIGTANRDELGQGFFVKYGDGGADLHPIMRLFKVQVFQLASFLGVNESILERPPTTDTYSAEVSQVEFYYGLDFERMDLITWGMETGVPSAEIAAVLGLTSAQVECAFTNIMRKRKATEYLRSAPPTLIGQGQESPIDPVLGDHQPARA